MDIQVPVYSGPNMNANGQHRPVDLPSANGGTPSETNGANTQGPSDLPGCEGLEPGLTQSYLANYGAHKVGIRTEECIKYYDDFAQKYEQNLSSNHYNGPVYAADTVRRYFPDSSRTYRLLDVAAGTGLVGEQLIARGFANIDALEPSEPMLKIAEEKRIYNKLIAAKLGGSTHTCIEDDAYDCLVLSGGMGEGHIPCSALPEMIRIIKPGGYVIIAMREEYLDYVGEYVNRLEPLMRDLQEQQLWKSLERSVVQGYSFGKNGVIFVFRVIAQGAPEYTSSLS